MSTLSSLTSRPALAVYLCAAVVVAVGAGVFAFQTASNTPYRTLNATEDNIAIQGYDTVAYFTEGKPMKGNSDFEHSWQDARWHFASATNRDMFAANPDRYGPQYGGYCALGVSAGEVSDVDPEAFTIVDGKLYLNKGMKFRKMFREAPEALIGMADYNWKNNRGGLRNVLNCETWPNCGFL